MWRETNLFGVLLSPLLLYAAAALLLTAASRWIALRLDLFRWVWNPALAEFAWFVCLLGLLVFFL